MRYTSETQRCVILNTSDVIRLSVEKIADEWRCMSKEEIHEAIISRSWVEFEVATTITGSNYTLVPVDFYDRIALDVEKMFREER